MFKAGKVLYETELESLRIRLRELLKNTKSMVALIVDDSGQLIASQGTLESVDPTLLGTLAAGNFGATTELAKLIGELEFTLVFHQGEKENIHITSIEDLGILVIIFSNKVPIGLVRMYAQKAIKTFVPILEKTLTEKYREQEKNKQNIPTKEDLDKLFNW
jgi:predicted regulator of Ras-like GTPase activity (Roadblock/LC7/MglB family)